MSNSRNESLLPSIWEEKCKENLEQLGTDAYQKHITDIYTCEMNTNDINEFETVDMSNHTVKYSSKRRLSKAKCVCISDEHQIVFISVLGSSSVEMLNGKGEYIGQIKSHSLKAPWGLAAYSDFLYVTDKANKCLMEFYIPKPHIKASIYEAKFSQPAPIGEESP